ncbi:MAG: hypothetical protein AAF363_19465 [Bacteroidota bacterium]
MSQAKIFEEFKDFVLFLYIYMADADGNIDISEIELILEKLKKLYPDELEHNILFEKAMAEFLDMKKSQVEEVLVSNFEYHSDESFTKKYKIFSDLYEIIHADGVVDERESKSIAKLKAMIERNID